MFSGAPPAQLSPAATTAAPLLLLQLAGTAGAARSGSDLHVVNIQMIVFLVLVFLSYLPSSPSQSLEYPSCAA